jgi:hypothetical protein
VTSRVSAKPSDCRYSFCALTPLGWPEDPNHCEPEALFHVVRNRSSPYEQLSSSEKSSCIAALKTLRSEYYIELLRRRNLTRPVRWRGPCGWRVATTRRSSSQTTPAASSSHARLDLVLPRARAAAARPPRAGQRQPQRALRRGVALPNSQRLSETRPFLRPSSSCRLDALLERGKPAARAHHVQRWAVCTIGVDGSKYLLSRWHATLVRPFPA